MRGQGHRGNPFHDERGRFTTAQGARKACVNGREIDPKQYMDDVENNNFHEEEGKYYKDRAKAREDYRNGVFLNGKPASSYSEKEYIQASMNSMPWDTAPKYKGKKNAKLMWLGDHPESKYNSPEFIHGIKAIERMSDYGSSSKVRQDMFKRLCKRTGISEAEGKHFISEEFLK